MSLVNKKDLVIGDLYYLDEYKSSFGYFVGYDSDGDEYFYPITPHSYLYADDGTVNLYSNSSYKYEEV